MDDQASYVRGAASSALGEIGDSRSVEPLIERLVDQHPSVRYAACQALARLGELRLAEAMVGAIQGEAEAREKLVRLVQEGDLRMVEPFIQRLGDHDSPVRRAACQALGQLRDTRAVDSLIERLADSSSDVRRAACQALGELADARAAEPLVNRLEDKYWDVREAACQALGQLAVILAVEPLIRRLGDEYSSVRQAACQALARLGEGRLANAVVSAIEGDAEAGAELARLAQEGDLRAVEPLLWCRNQAAFRALRSIGKAAKDPRQLFCRSCLAVFNRRDHRLLLGTVSVPVCRLCGRADKAMTNVRELVAVLDTKMSEELSCADGVARLSCLKRGALFDFDRVEILRAGDYEVERFCIQVGNDADPFRRGRYRRMRCLVAPGCRLSENTLRILGTMFGKVESRA